MRTGFNLRIEVNRRFVGKETGRAEITNHGADGRSEKLQRFERGFFLKP